VNDRTPNPEQDEMHAELAFDRTMRESQGLNLLEAQKAANDGLKAKAAILWMLALLVFVATILLPVVALRLT
jgi:hypothetical protein